MVFLTMLRTVERKGCFGYIDSRAESIASVLDPAGDMTVAQWIETRSLKCYPGFDSVVLDARRNVVPGRFMLFTVRESCGQGPEAGCAIRSCATWRRE